jgi:tape measure domain-containing protein
MATNKKDVELALRVTADGAADVQALSGDVQSLAAKGKELGSSFQVGAEGLAALTAKTKEFRQAEAAAAADLKASKQAYADQKDAIDRLKASYQASGGDAAQYRKELGALRLALVDAKAAIREKQDALTAASNAAKNAASAERALGEQIKTTSAQQAAAAKGVGESLSSIGAQLTQVRTLVAAAFGGQLLGGAAAQVSHTADEYKNLAARIKLATGEGAAFDAAFQGVFEVAQRTNTAVEATGNLFTKVLQSGKALNIGVADALRLTEAINQATQLSGSSAESSNAALIQLVQGLQSGVLRGDEFNSVMENAPRLALALADGLGVTTGALRTMAEAGKLTSATVIAALQGQSAVLQSEFDKLPATIGRALSNLSTGWTEYIGKVDQAHGASAAAAGVINLLAKNLDTLGTLLIDAGESAIAFKAIGLAQVFFNQSAAIAAATSATATNTAATTANTAAKQANATATAAAGEAAAASGGKLAGAIGSLKLGALALILPNLRDIGTALGEGVAKWAGWGKKIEEADAAAKAEAETTRANAAAKAALAQQLQIASDKALGLTVESRKLVDEFDGLRLKGESTAEALEKLTKSLRIGTDLKGITDAGAALDALGVKGELSATQIRHSWATALKSVDLGVFATAARAAFDDSEQGARRFAAAMDGALHEAIRRTGTDFELISTGMGTAAKSALNDLDIIIGGLDKLKASGAETSQLLAAAIAKAIDSADSQKALDSLRLQIESVRGALGDRVADGFLDQTKVKANELKDALDKALPGVQSLREAFKQLGLQAPEDLSRTAAANKSAWDTIKADGSVGADALKAAFARYAQSALDASGAAGTAARDVTRGLLEAEAGAKGLAVEFDNTGRVIVRGAFDSALAIDKTTAAVERQTTAVKELANAQKTTADGFAKGPDGAAAGTFNNNLPVDQAFALIDSVKNGAKSNFTPEAAQAAFLQATNAFQDMQAFMKQNPGAASFDYQNSTTALYQGAKAALAQVLSQQGLGQNLAGAPPGSPPPGVAAAPAAGGSTRTININMGGVVSSINVASQADGDALEALLQRLATAKGAAA